MITLLLTYKYGKMMNVRFNALLLSLVILSAGCAGSQSTNREKNKNAAPLTETHALLKFQEEVSVDYMREHLTVFSSDSLEGRETGTRGEDRAAEYLAEQYRKMGLQPAGDDGTYFQGFKLNATQSDSVSFRLYKTEGEEKSLIGKSTESKNSTGEFIRRFGGTKDTLQGSIVFAGFGVNDTSRKISHLTEGGLKGKWVMVFQEIPNIVAGDTLINPALDGRSRFRTIMGKGAEGILLVPVGGHGEFDEMAKQMRSNYGKIGRMSLAYRDQNSGSSGGFSRGYNLVKPALAARMLGLESDSAMVDYRQKLIDNITDFQPKPLNYELVHIPYSSKKEIKSRNVAAFYEGADPRVKDEVVVMTSHYDHVGIGRPDSTGDRIYNGADDDGSGTIGLLNVARAFAEAGKKGVKPRRSLLFLNVSAEEKGLLGSRYYSDHAIFPIEKTVANINTDMIGRIDSEHKKRGVEDYSYIIGADIISSGLDSLLRRANEQSGQIELSMRYNDLQDPNQFYRRSDHWHFGRKGIPFVFFFTGVHEDYHRPSDEVHKIRFKKMAKIVRTMYATAVMVANAEEAPAVDNQEFIEITTGDS